MIDEQLFDVLILVLDKGLLAILGLAAAYWLKARLAEREAISSRSVVPRTQFDIDCSFVGPHDGHYATVIYLTVANKSQRRRKFGRIAVRVRGIDESDGMDLWQTDGNDRLEFPRRYAKGELIAKGDYYYVEPDVTQLFTYVTRVPASARILLVHTRFIALSEEYEERHDRLFTDERVFTVPRSVVPAVEAEQA